MRCDGMRTAPSLHPSDDLKRVPASTDLRLVKRKIFPLQDGP